MSIGVQQFVLYDSFQKKYVVKPKEKEKPPTFTGNAKEAWRFSKEDMESAWDTAFRLAWLGHGKFSVREGTTTLSPGLSSRDSEAGTTKIVLHDGEREVYVKEFGRNKVIFTEKLEEALIFPSVAVNDAWTVAYKLAWMDLGHFVVLGV